MSLSGFDTLETVSGDLENDSNAELAIFSGLHNVTTVNKSDFICSDHDIEAIQGLKRLHHEAFDVSIFKNDLLADSDGLNSLDTTGKIFSIEENGES